MEMSRICLKKTNTLAIANSTSVVRYAPASSSMPMLHGRAGELAAEDLGPRSVMARDVLDALPEAFQELEQGNMGLDEMLQEDDEGDEGPWG